MSSSAEITLEEETEASRVISWRAEELERAGWSEQQALKLAFRTDIDLHLAVDLLRVGCPHETALRILL